MRFATRVLVLIAGACGHGEAVPVHNQATRAYPTPNPITTEEATQFFQKILPATGTTAWFAESVSFLSIPDGNATLLCDHQQLLGAAAGWDRDLKQGSGMSVFCSSTSDNGVVCGRADTKQNLYIGIFIRKYGDEWRIASVIDGHTDATTSEKIRAFGESVRARATEPTTPCRSLPRQD